MTSTSEIWKELTSICSNLNNFHSLEVVDRVSETQLQMGENSDLIIWRLKGYNLVFFLLSMRIKLLPVFEKKHVNFRKYNKLLRLCFRFVFFTAGINLLKNRCNFFSISSPSLTSPEIDAKCFFCRPNLLFRE